MSTPRDRIGGSDVAAILGHSPWLTQRELWLRIVHGKTPPVDEPHLEYCAELEPIILSRYCRRTGAEVACAGYERRIELDGATIGAPELVGHPDAMCRIDGRDVLVELKSVAHWRDWGRDETGNIPAYYLCQCLHYLALMPQCRELHIAAMHRLTGELRVYRLDRGVWADQIAGQLEAVRAWWARHVDPALDLGLTYEETFKFAPPGDDVVPAADHRPQSRSAFAGPGEYALVQRYRDAKEALKAVEAEVEVAHDALMARLAELEVDQLTRQDGTWIVKIVRSERTSIDTAALKRQAPEIAARFSRTVTSTSLRLARD
ncbi:MAG: YqaJ viral recombinase family protein [Gammaproteobacteria bacterium]|nr:YqaJ viral recombinase family protein [Gammaproteobacteria bacterium]